MKKVVLLAILGLLSFILIVKAAPIAADPFYLGGIQVNEPDMQQWVQGLKQANMNTVAVTVYASQGDWDSDNLRFDTQNEGLVQEIRAAKAEGLHVVLILRVALDHAFEANEFLWHGQIMPRTDEQLDTWFQKYTEFVMLWAKIAQQEGVDVLGIGSEMNALTSTQPIQDFPTIVQYYLDDAKQQKLRQEFVHDRHNVTVDDLYAPSGQQFATLENFLDARLQAWQGWARQISWQDRSSEMSDSEKNGAIATALQNTIAVDNESTTLTTSTMSSPEAITNNTINRSEAIAYINQRRHRLEHHWRRLIRQVKNVYSGQLSYAANFDQYQEVGFWDDLDLMGINAYFSLRSDLSPVADEPENKREERERAELASTLEAGWQNALGQISSFRQQQYLTDKPVLFTELGYTYRSNSTVTPWAYDNVTLVDLGDDPVLMLANEQSTDFEERAMAVNALHQVLQQDYPTLLNGILYWKLSTQSDHLAIEPFVLILNHSPKDPLQHALNQFQHTQR